MFKKSRKIQAALAAVTLASLTFITAPAANAATASAGGNTCEYSRTRSGNTVTVSTSGCTGVKAGARYVSAAGTYYVTLNKNYAHPKSTFTITSAVTVVGGRAQALVPWGIGKAAESPVYSF